MSTIRWLHISDFHYGDPRRQQREQPWKDMSLPKVDLLFFTGDLRNINEPDFQPGVDMLQQVKSQLHLGKNDLFLVPGNHDVDQMDPVHSRAFQEFAIRRLGSVQNVPADVLDEDGRPLTDRFSQFAAAVAPVWGRPNSTPAQVSVHPWKDKLNVIGLNTALLSTLDSSQSQIVDSAALAALEPEDPSLPAIVLGHHSFYDLAPEQQEYLKGHFARLNVRAYLHGDLHQRVENPILLADGRLIPCIAAPTIAKKPGDGFAQRGAYLYEWDVGSPQGKVTVIPYRWEKGRLERGEPGPIDSFPMRDTSRGLWEEDYRPWSKDLSRQLLPGIVYQPEGGSAQVYPNDGTVSLSPMVELFWQHREEKYFQLVGAGRQACGGTGKTSTLLDLAEAMTSPDWDQERIVPLYFELKTLYRTRRREQDDRENRIIAYAKKHYRMEEGERHPKTLFLLDGFNEICGPKLQERCLEDIREIMEERYPDDGVIITSRDPVTSYIQLWEYQDNCSDQQLQSWKELFRSCYVQQMSQEQMAQCVKPPAPEPEDPIWSVLDTPFYLVLYHNTTLPLGAGAKRWLTPDFAEHLKQERQDKVTLMLQLMLREIDRFLTDEEGLMGERRSFFLMKALPYLGYQKVLGDRLDPELSSQPVPRSSRTEIYRCTHLCLSACLSQPSIWPEYKDCYGDKLEQAWGKLQSVYQRGQKVHIGDLTEAVPYSTFLFGLLVYRERENAFCHENYQDFFAALHIANTVYAFSSGLKLKPLRESVQQIFLLQLEVFDHRILLDTISILRQYFGLDLKTAALYYELEGRQQDPLSQLGLLAILIRLLDAQIQHLYRQTGEVVRELQNCQRTFFSQFIKRFDDLKDRHPLVPRQYGQYYGYILAMLARDYREQRKLVECAGYAARTTDAERAYRIHKADGYLQLGLCLNARMEDLLNGKGPKSVKLPYKLSLAEKVFRIMGDYCGNRKEAAVKELKKLLFPQWKPELSAALDCADIFYQMLSRAHEKYKAASLNSTDGDIRRLGFVSKAYLVLAAVGTSGGALNLLAQMLINQADLLEEDPRLPFFKTTPRPRAKSGLRAREYKIGRRDHYAMAYQVLQVVCGIRRGNQPYSRLKVAELILKHRVSVADSDAQVEAALEIAIGGDQPMGYYWKGRYYLEKGADEKGIERAISCFRSTGAADFAYGRYLEDAQFREHHPLKAHVWLSAIELLGFPEKAVFTAASPDQVYEAVYGCLRAQVSAYKSGSVILRHQRARLTRQDIAENLDRFLQVASGQFPEEKKQRVEALRQALPD